MAAGLIPEDIINQIRERVDIAEVIIHPRAVDAGPVASRRGADAQPALGADVLRPPRGRRRGRRH